MKLSNSLDLISDVIMRTSTKEELSLLLEDLLTPSEILEIWDRIMIIKYLKYWLKQREIASKLSISITTVSRWNRLYVFEKKAIHNLI